MTNKETGLLKEGVERRPYLETVRPDTRLRWRSLREGLVAGFVVGAFCCVVREKTYREQRSTFTKSKIPK